MQVGLLSRYFALFFVIVLLPVLGAACGALSPAPKPTPISIPDGWNQIWHDEFDGDSIDTKNWTYDLGAGGWGNGEAEYYTSRPENARLENGVLVIEARQEKYEDSYYTSARLKTQGLQSFQYGRMEVGENRNHCVGGRPSGC